jgi:hypothetical protein
LKKSGGVESYDVRGRASDVPASAIERRGKPVLQALGIVGAKFPANPSSQIRAKIEVCQEDIFRLWGRTGESLPLVERDMDVG